MAFSPKDARAAAPVHPHRPPPRPTHATTPLAGPVFSNALPPLVIEALQRGEKVQAIRLMREISGVGLKEAKDLVDASPHATARSGLSPGEVPRTGRTIWMIVAAVLLAWLLYVAMRSPG